MNLAQRDSVTHLHGDLKASDQGIRLYATNRQIASRLNVTGSIGTWIFLLITNGYCSFDMIKSQSEYGKGLLVIPPYVKNWLISFDESFQGLLFELPDKLVSERWATRIHAELSEKDTEIIKRYYSLMNNVTANPGTSHSGMEMVCLCRAFVASCRQHFEMELFAKQNTRPAEIANRFLSLADRHSHRERELEFYAREMGISPKYLSAVIMSATKKRATSLIFERAIAYAKDLLLNSRKSITSIAEAMDFKTPSEFCRFFKNNTGMSPNAFRHQGDMR